MAKDEDRLELQVIPGDTISPRTRDGVITLWARAFEQDMSLWKTLEGAVHVLGRLGPKLVTHALWVTRWLQAGTGPLLRTAYVEAVATEAAYRKRGFATDAWPRKYKRSTWVLSRHSASLSMHALDGRRGAGRFLSARMAVLFPHREKGK